MVMLIVSKSCLIKFDIRKLYKYIIFYFVSLLFPFNSPDTLVDRDFPQLFLHQNFSTKQLCTRRRKILVILTEFVREATTKPRDLRRLTIVGGHAVVLILISG